MGWVNVGELSTYSEAAWHVLLRQNVLDDCTIALHGMPNLADYDCHFDLWQLLILL